MARTDCPFCAGDGFIEVEVPEARQTGAWRSWPTASAVRCVWPMLSRTGIRGMGRKERANNDHTPISQC